MKFVISESAGRTQAWFDNLSRREQKAYLESHPNSKYSKPSAKTGGSKTSAEKFKTAKSLNEQYGAGTSGKFVKSDGQFYLNHDVHHANRTAAKKVLSEGLGIKLSPADHVDFSKLRTAHSLEKFVHDKAKQRGVKVPKGLPEKFAKTLIHGDSAKSRVLKAKPAPKPGAKTQTFKNKLDALRQKLATAKPEDIVNIRFQIQKIREQIAASKYPSFG